jgi:hypothetical protein
MVTMIAIIAIVRKVVDMCRGEDNNNVGTIKTPGQT